jgi:hypothetical protein
MKNRAYHCNLLIAYTAEIGLNGLFCLINIAKSVFLYVFAAEFDGKTKVKEFELCNCNNSWY